MSVNKTANAEIRAEAKRAHIPLWVIADELGLSDSGFSRLLRHELPDSEKQKILSIIQELDREGGVSHV